MAKGKPFDLEHARKLYLNDRWSTSQIADLLGVHLQTVINHFKKAGIPLRPQGQTTSNINPKIIKDLYLQNGLSVKEISAKLNISTSLVRKKLRECGIRVKRSGGHHRAIEVDHDKLKKLYCEDRLTLKACARHFKVSDTVIRRHLGELGIKIRPSTHNFLSDIDDDKIIDLYWNQKMSISQVADKLGHSPWLVRCRLAKSGRGTRSVSEGARAWRGSDDVSDDQLIYLYDVCGWSCEQISAYFGKSSQFTRQRFMAIGKKRRNNTGKYNSSWKGGITNIRNTVRSCAASLQWRKDAFERQKYCSEISGQQVRELNCHHIYPFHVILQSSITKHRPLSDEYRSLAIVHDNRFYDTVNSLVVSKDEHDKIEDSPENSHPWWKIWQAYPDFVVKRSELIEEDFGAFEKNGMVSPNNYAIVPSTTKEIKTIIRYEHYLGTIFGPSLILVAKKGNIIIGIAVFGKGTNKNIKSNIWELTRFCIPFYVEKPFACQFLNDCCNYIRINHPNITGLISFADSSVGHNGGIYRMAGWEKAGKTPPSYVYFDTTTFSIRHKAACRRIKGINMTEKELAESRGWIKVPTSHKYKYTTII